MADSPRVSRSEANPDPLSQSLEELEYWRDRLKTRRYTLLEGNPALKNPEVKALLPEFLEPGTPLPDVGSARATRGAVLRLRNLDERIALYEKAIELKQRGEAAGDVPGLAPEAVGERGIALELADGRNTGAAEVATLPRGGKEPGQRECINAFIARLTDAGYKITRKDIWTVAGYGDRTEFERFQRDNRVTQAAIRNFSRVLQMTPSDFKLALKNTQASK